MLEYVRQLVGLQSLLSSKHKAGIDFSVSIGYFACSKIQVAKLAEQELQDLNFKEYDPAREFYDPYGKLKQAMTKAYEGHRPSLEDFWANLQDNFEVREKRYNRLSMPQVRDFIIDSNLLKDLRDDGDLLDLAYRELGIDKRPLSPIKWSTSEDTNMGKVSQVVISRTKQWLRQRVRPSVSKAKQKESTSGVPQSRGHKEYARKTRSASRKNTSIDPGEEEKPQESTKNLLKKFQEKMRDSELLKKAEDL